MTRLRTLQTNFTAGEISPLLYGRGELRAYDNGAARLRNVIIQPTGGVTRRPGLYHVDTLPGPARLVAFEFNTEQTYLLAFTHLAMRVYRNAAPIATLAVPWTAAQLSQLSWTQSADTLLVCHPEVEPRAITRHGELDWQIGPWPFVVEGGASRVPFHRFAPSAVSLTPSAATGAITLAASAAVFVSQHAGTLFRLGGRQVRIDAVTGTTAAAATVIETLSGTAATVLWDEQAWSAARGWPVSATFHQDRLAVGGSRDLPNRLWMSRAGELFNFDVGTGLDDQAIAFPILSDQVNAVRAVFSGRHLQVFTSGAEWMVSGEPLTPQSVQIHRQTRVGSPVERNVPPRDVDGATLYVARNGQQLREFLYADIEQAYRSTDLALLAHDLIDHPADQDYDPTRRLLHVVMADGTIGTLTVYRSEQVTAWTRIDSDGGFGAVAAVDDDIYVTVQRGGVWRIETFTDGLQLDAALTGSAAVPIATWTGLGHLEGRTVRVVADGVDRGAYPVIGGQVVLAIPARAVAIGLPYAHTIQPLAPFLLGSGGGSQGVALRPVATTFRLHRTQALVLDTGGGPRTVPLQIIAEAELDEAPPEFSGDRTLRHLGWTRSATAPLWRIEQDVPLPFTLLCVTTELKVNE